MGSEMCIRDRGNSVSRTRESLTAVPNSRHSSQRLECKGLVILRGERILKRDLSAKIIFQAGN